MGELSISKVSDWKRLHPIKDGQDQVVELPQSYPHETFQWVSGIKSASSTYAAGWETETIIGSPRVFPQYGDIRGAWAPRTSKGTMESLQLLFTVPIFPTGVDIFETYNPGHIIRISFLRYSVPQEVWEVAWENTTVDLANLPQHSRVYSPSLKEKIFMFKSNCVKIDLDCVNARSWCEIDCVVLRGLMFLEWCPEKHKNFPESFKNMVKTFLLVNQRHEGTSKWLPRVMLYEIFNHCALSWPMESEIQRAAEERKKWEEKWNKAKKEINSKVSKKLSIWDRMLLSEEAYSEKKKAAQDEAVTGVINKLKTEGVIPTTELEIMIQELNENK